MSNNKLGIDIALWASQMVQNWENKITSLGIIDTATLLNSFEAHVTWSSKGDPDKITFAYEYYGNFVDWGLGRGVCKDNRATAYTRRERKAWYSDVFLTGIRKLQTIVSESTASNAAFVIVKKLEEFK